MALSQTPGLICPDIAKVKDACNSLELGSMEDEAASSVNTICIPYWNNKWRLIDCKRVKLFRGICSYTKVQQIFGVPPKLYHGINLRENNPSLAAAQAGSLVAGSEVRGHGGSGARLGQPCNVITPRLSALTQKSLIPPFSTWTSWLA